MHHNSGSHSEPLLDWEEQSSSSHVLATVRNHLACLKVLIFLLIPCVFARLLTGDGWGTLNASAGPVIGIFMLKDDDATFAWCYGFVSQIWIINQCCGINSGVPFKQALSLFVLIMFLNAVLDLYELCITQDLVLYGVPWIVTCTNAFLETLVVYLGLRVLEAFLAPETEPVVGRGGRGGRDEGFARAITLPSSSQVEVARGKQDAARGDYTQGRPVSWSGGGSDIMPVPAFAKHSRSSSACAPGERDSHSRGSGEAPSRSRDALVRNLTWNPAKAKRPRPTAIAESLLGAAAAVAAEEERPAGRFGFGNYLSVPEAPNASTQFRTPQPPRPHRSTVGELWGKDEEKGSPSKWFPAFRGQEAMPAISFRSPQPPRPSPL